MIDLKGLLNTVWDVSTGHVVPGLSGLLRALVVWVGRGSVFHPSLILPGTLGFCPVLLAGPYTKQLGNHNFLALRELKVATKITIL